jgi:hypothetical protein
MSHRPSAKVLHAWGDLISGHKEIIMEDLTKGHF